VSPGIKGGSIFVCIVLFLLSHVVPISLVTRLYARTRLETDLCGRR
jgi:hypothetical protein